MWRWRRFRLAGVVPWCSPMGGPILTVTYSSTCERPAAVLPRGALRFEPLFPVIDELLARRKASSPDGAAKQLAASGIVPGNGVLQSRATQLAKAYREKNPAKLRT
jgi:hypothetical protein